MTTVSIPLTQGKFAVIDEADYPLVAPFKWHAKKSGKTFYAAPPLSFPIDKPYRHV